MTVIEPAQRFVVERMARRLNIDIPECDLRHGELTLTKTRAPPILPLRGPLKGKARALTEV